MKIFKKALIIYAGLILGAYGADINIYKGWQLLGTTQTINSLNDFNKSSIEILWCYDQNLKQWLAYSLDKKINDKILSLGIKLFSNIKSNSGYWLLSNDFDKLHIETNETNDFNLKKGWNLAGYSKAILDIGDFNTSDIKLIWGYDGNSQTWSAFSPNDATQGIIDSNDIKRLNTIFPNDGFWIYANKEMQILQNQKPVAIFGDNNTTITAYTDTILPALGSSKSYDNDGKIVYCKIEDDKGRIIDEKYDGICELKNHKIHTEGNYLYKLCVIDDKGAKDTKEITIHILQNPNPIIQNYNFPTTFLPTKAHPRLWLTQDRLDELQRQRQNQTQKWLDFKQMCDNCIDDDISNDPYGLDISPQNFTAPLALMYRLTGDTRYADKAMELMDKVSLNLSLYGDPDHQSFYFMGLTYDWLYNYAKMSETKKAQYREKMKALSDEFYTRLNQSASGTDSDQNLLTALLHLVFGVAIYEDDSNAILLLNRAWEGWQRGYYNSTGISNKMMIKSALGGVYFTGMAYFPSTDIIGIAGFEITLKTACGYDVNTLESELKPFWSNIIKAIISLTEPTKQRILDYGSWQDPNILSNQPWLRRALIISSYFALKTNDIQTAKFAKGYAQNVDVGYNNDCFLELFFDTNLTPLNPYENSNSLELVKFFNSPDFLLFRDSWDKNASFGEFRGDGLVPLDQQAPDSGHFSLWRRGSYLTKGARNYEALSHGDFFNTLSIQNSCTLNGQSCSGTAIFKSEKPAKISRVFTHNSSPLFAYGMLEADGQWDDNDMEYNPVQNIKTYRRHFFWIPRYVIVFDRVRANKPLNIRYRLRALQEPCIISNNIVSQMSQNKNSKLLQITLEPKDIILKKLDESQEWAGIEDWIINRDQRKWQSYIDFNKSKDLNILNLMQMGDVNMSNFDRYEHLTTTNYSGVHIGNWSVVFSSREILHKGIRYSIKDTKANLHHIVADLVAGSYNLYINGRYIKKINVKKDSNIAYFTTDTQSQKLTISLIKQIL